MSVISKAVNATRAMGRNRAHKKAGGTGEAPNFSLVGGPVDKSFHAPSVIKGQGIRDTPTPSSLLPAVIENGSAAGYTAKMSGLVGDGLGFANGAKAVGSYGKGEFMRNTGSKDMGDVARWAAGRAGRGAVVGGAIGGTAEAGQGGSFWSGAKAGAFNGAVGWTAYRGAGNAFAGGSKNPAKMLGGFGNSFGMISADATKMTTAAGRATTAQRDQMSKSVQAIMKNQKDTATAKGMM